MREYLFTEIERGIINDYIENEVKKPGFRVLKYRIIENYEKISRDFELLKNFKEKINVEK